MANKLELVSSGGIPHCYNHNVISKKFEANRPKIKRDCQLYVKAVPQDSKSDLPLIHKLRIVDFLSIFIINSRIFVLMAEPKIPPWIPYRMRKLF